MNAMTTALPALSNLSPAVAIHLTAAVLATALGPVALWARRSQVQRPRLHRATGYAWVTLMVLAALSALFISGSPGPRLAGFGPIHLLVPFALGTNVLSFRYLQQGNLSGHRHTPLVPACHPLRARQCDACPAVSAHGKHWAIFPALGWAIGLAAHGLAVFVLGSGSRLHEHMVQTERERLQTPRRPR